MVGPVVCLRAAFFTSAHNGLKGQVEICQEICQAQGWEDEEH